MKHRLGLFFVLFIGMLFAVRPALAAEQLYSSYPSFSIISVLTDTKVTIKTYNLPPNDTFEVLMNTMGTRGINGYHVATLNTGAGGTQVLTYEIPPELYGLYQIAVRLQSTSGSNYYAYNWFYNDVSGSGSGGVKPPAGYSGYPTLSITNVVRDVSVTVRAKNLPPDDEFRVLMNTMGTRGVNGFTIASFETSGGGTDNFTFDIPDSLKGLRQIAIRIESKTGSGYYAFNWFYNNSTGNSENGTGGQNPGGSTIYPTFSIVGVVRNNTVTIKTHNLPANDEYRVLMNTMGTRGIGGYNATSFGTGEGGTQNFTIEIPSELYGLAQIAIRIESKSGSGYFAYNWFYNNTYP